MKTKNRKKNMRRKFFNAGKGEQCRQCGALLVPVTDLAGNKRGLRCPVKHL